MSSSSAVESDFRTAFLESRSVSTFDSVSRDFVLTQESVLADKSHLRWTIPIFYEVSGRLVTPPMMFHKDAKELRIPVNNEDERSYRFNPNTICPMDVRNEYENVPEEAPMVSSVTSRSEAFVGKI